MQLYSLADYERDCLPAVGGGLCAAKPYRFGYVQGCHYTSNGLAQP